MTYYNSSHTLCGCWYVFAGSYQKTFLPLVELKSHTTILATTSRTKLTQTFQNPLTKEKLDEVQYTFPLYDGVAVVSFRCTIAGRTIIGQVKEKQQARTDYQAAVDRGETAGLLEQIPEASDAFTTKIGNIAANEKVIVEIEYLGELKHDAESDGSRFTIPTIIAPRYGATPAGSHSSAFSHGISISVDVAVDNGSIIRGIQSPSHPIAVTMGRISTANDEDSFDNHHASATLTLGSTCLEKDFIVVVLAKGQDTPRALLETHPSIPNQRALMATLVPKFNLPSIHPEIVFVVDRSGSMGGKIPTLIAALNVFLKSLPVGVKFNICSFGSHHKFMFNKSRTYDQSNLQEALRHVKSFAADFGGTEMYRAIEATFNNRLPGMPLEVLVLTDGEIWNQQQLFDYVNTFCANGSTRLFSLGIGSGASSSLVEGLARAGDGFAQFVDDNEKMDKRVVRMLKGALSPHIRDYQLEVKYTKPANDMEDDFEMVESVDSGIAKLVVDVPKKEPLVKKKISLFDTSTYQTLINPPAGRYDHLPKIAPPAVLQSPHKVPTLFSFNRTTVYLLLGPNACQQTPTSVILRATSEHGPLELEIPVQDVGTGETIHQLAAKKAVHEIEQGRGWLSASSFKKAIVGTQYESRMDEIIEREAVRLGVELQVGGKFCSFVAVEDGVEQLLPPQYKPDDDEGILPPKKELKMQSSMTSSFFGLGPNLLTGNIARAPASKSARRSAPSSGLSFGAPAQNFAAAKAPCLRRGGSGVNALFGSVSNKKDALFGGAAPSGPPPAPAPPAQAQGFVNMRSRQSAALCLASQESDACSISANAIPFQCPAPQMDMDSQFSQTLSDSSSCSMSFHASRASDTSTPVAAKLSDEDKVRALIDLNQFDGSWLMTAELGRIIGPDWDVAKALDLHAWTSTARATAMVVAFLEVKMGKEVDIWEMVVEKARDWLAATVSDANARIDGIKGLLATA